MDRTFKHGETNIKVSARRDKDAVHLVTADGERSFDWEEITAGNYVLRSEGKLRRCIVARDGDDRWVWIEGHVHHLQVVSGARKRAASAGDMVAPMPGQVLKVFAAAGQSVDKGAVLVTLEAMKMQYEIKAPRNGVVRAVHVEENEQVAGGQELVSLEAAGDA